MSLGATTKVVDGEIVVLVLDLGSHNFGSAAKVELFGWVAERL